MLESHHRLRSSEEIRTCIRRGVKKGSGTVVAYLWLPHSPAVVGGAMESAGSAGALKDPARPGAVRCAVVTSKALGNSVVRHTVARQIRHALRNAMRAEVPGIPDDFFARGGADIVVRCLPGVVGADPETVAADMQSVLRRCYAEAQRRGWVEKAETPS